MAEEGSWPSIRKQGLLSTTALLDVWDVSQEERYAIESILRPNSAVIQNPLFGKAVVRDQRPMNEKNVRKVLEDMKPEEWYLSLNRKVFFWVRLQRLLGLLNARAYKSRKHVVLLVDTNSLVTEHKDRIWLSPINSGSTIYGNGKRGSKTFKRIDDYQYEDERKRRGENAIVELAVDYSVPDIESHVIRVEEWFGPNRTSILWQR